MFPFIPASLEKALRGLFVIRVYGSGGGLNPAGIYSQGPSASAVGCKNLDVIENHESGLSGFWYDYTDALIFQRGPKTFHRRVVVAVAFAAH